MGQTISIGYRNQ